MIDTADEILAEAGVPTQTLSSSADPVVDPVRNLWKDVRGMAEVEPLRPGLRGMLMAALALAGVFAGCAEESPTPVWNLYFADSGIDVERPVAEVYDLETNLSLTAPGRLVIGSRRFEVPPDEALVLTVSTDPPTQITFESFLRPGGSHSYCAAGSTDRDRTEESGQHRVRLIRGGDVCEFTFYDGEPGSPVLIKMTMIGRTGQTVHFKSEIQTREEAADRPSLRAPP